METERIALSQRERDGEEVRGEEAFVCNRRVRQIHAAPPVVVKQDAAGIGLARGSKATRAFVRILLNMKLRRQRPRCLRPAAGPLARSSAWTTTGHRRRLTMSALALASGQPAKRIR
jgi:hypothetical protein